MVITSEGCTKWVIRSQASKAQAMRKVQRLHGSGTVCESTPVLRYSPPPGKPGVTDEVLLDDQHYPSCDGSPPPGGRLWNSVWPLAPREVKQKASRSRNAAAASAAVELEVKAKLEKGESPGLHAFFSSAGSVRSVPLSAPKSSSLSKEKRAGSHSPSGTYEC